MQNLEQRWSVLLFRLQLRKTNLRTDDGIDLWDFASPVTIEDTLIWGNGYNR